MLQSCGDVQTRVQVVWATYETHFDSLISVIGWVVLA